MVCARSMALESSHQAVANYSQRPFINRFSTYKVKSLHAPNSWKKDVQPILQK
jgi:hypothetical protein